MSKVIIIGAGPAGLTAAYELLKLNKGFEPVLIESLDQVGGISKTINFKGNRIDIGGHRFFSKSDIIMDWWQDILPIKKEEKQKDVTISYQNKSKKFELQNKPIVDENKVMLIRERLSRIFYLRNFFDYPIKINIATVLNLGFFRIFKILLSYFKSRLSPIKEEKSLEDFFINRFGYELYSTFFRDYTEKVWGVKCTEIKPEWGSQRIKGLSVTTAIIHFAKSLLPKSKSISQKNVETSLIERFMYPKLGPGQLWEEVKDRVLANGGILNYNETIIEVIKSEDNKILKVVSKNSITNELKTYEGDYFISTMPIKDLINAINLKESEEEKKVIKTANELVYRDFITVGLLLNKLKIKNKDNTQIKDNWIYIQESDVKIGRLQIFNNWSPYLVSDQSKMWIGLEYFCNENDDLWNLTERQMKSFAIAELEKIGIIESNEVIDGVVVKVPKTYPAYTGGYENFNIIQNYIDKFENLFLIGRNGMHKYNNQDHSMLTAINAVLNIDKGIKTKDNLWAINTEEDYHEEK